MSHPNPRLFTLIAFAACLIAAAQPPPVVADDWTMYATVDNVYDLYCGDVFATDTYVGGDTGHWLTVETWNMTNRDAQDYLYVACASDRSVQQGFLGEFRNTTTGSTILTGSPLWQVFPAGAHLQEIDPTWPSVWPDNQLPSQAQVDAAIAFATANDLWQDTASGGSFNNDLGTWGALPEISPAAEWIWHDSGRDPGGATVPVPYHEFNHDEFLVFRVPEPTSIGLLTIAVLMIRRSRFR